MKNNYIELRRNICGGCDKRKKILGVSVCGECGCNIWAKTMVPNQRCPINHWGTKEEMQEKYDIKD
ncbi:hypothetical protein EBU95_15835 [bacterium]|nr:hypothetical protein [bacterium]